MASNIYVAAIMMAKNEESNILRSVQSLASDPSKKQRYVDRFILYDTGSTDKTIELARAECEKMGLEFELLQGEFVNFCVSRNVLLDFAADSLKKVAETTGKVPWMVLMDANDELHNTDALKPSLAKLGPKKTLLHVTVTLRNGSAITKFKNVRTVRYDTTYRYRGAVHEALYPPQENNIEFDCHDTLPEPFTIYQDRGLDTTGSSQRRWLRDYRLLSKDYLENPTSTRTVFYLAQTCKCLGWLEKALFWYQKRNEFTDTFEEEKYLAFLECGNIWEAKYNRFDHELAEIGHFIDSLTEEMKADLEPQTQQILEKFPRYYISVRQLHSLDELHEMQKLQGVELTPMNPEQNYIVQTNHGIASVMTLIDEKGETFTVNVESLDVAEWKRTLCDWWLRANEKAYNVIPLAAPLLGIAKVHDIFKNYQYTYLNLKASLDISFPSHLVLWHEQEDYKYNRHHHLGAMCWYIQKFEEGYVHASIAYNVHKKQRDLDNVNIYKEELQKRNIPIPKIKFEEEKPTKPKVEAKPLDPKQALRERISKLAKARA